MKHLYTLAQEIIALVDEINLYREGISVGSFWNEPEAEKYILEMIARKEILELEFRNYPVEVRIAALKAHEGAAA
jgi:hypothetical protein